MADRNKVRPNAATRNGAQISVLLPSFSFSPPNMFLVWKEGKSRNRNVVGSVKFTFKGYFSTGKVIWSVSSKNSATNIEKIHLTGSYKTQTTWRAISLLIKEEYETIYSSYYVLKVMSTNIFYVTRWINVKKVALDCQALYC